MRSVRMEFPKLARKPSARQVATIVSRAWPISWRFLTLFFNINTYTPIYPSFVYPVNACLTLWELSMENNALYRGLHQYKTLHFYIVAFFECIYTLEFVWIEAVLLCGHVMHSMQRFSNISEVQGCLNFTCKDHFEGDGSVFKHLPS